MEVSGTRRLIAQPGALHRALDSATVLKSCLQICDSFTGSIADGYDFAVSHKIGPLSVTFRGHASFARAAEGQGYVMDFTGSSRMTGQVSGRLTLAISPRPRQTLMDYQATLEPSAVVKLLGADRVQRAFASGINGFADRLKGAVER